MTTPPMKDLNTIQDNYEKYKDMFTTEKNDIVTMESFYELLVAEMQNQDPLEPTSNTEFISQMATFTSLQATQDNFAMQQQNYARSLIGQNVGVSDGGSELVQGIVEYATFGDEIMIRVNGKNYPLTSLKMVYGTGEATGTSTSQISDYGAFAASLIGKNVVVQAVDATGRTIYDEGTATSIEIQDGIVRVVLNGYAYNVTDVVSVSGAEDTTGASIDYTLQQLTQAIEGIKTPAESTQPEQIADVTDKNEETEEIADVTPTENDTEANDELADYTSEEDIQDIVDEDETNSLYELFR